MSSLTKMGESEPMFMNAATISYHLERLHARLYFDESVLRSIRLNNWRDQASSRFAVEMVAAVAVWNAARLLKVPADWWQHLKERWFPAWALKRWPVLYVWHDAAVILPKVPIVNPDYHTVEYAVWKVPGPHGEPRS